MTTKIVYFVCLFVIFCSMALDCKILRTFCINVNDKCSRAKPNIIKIDKSLLINSYMIVCVCVLPTIIDQLYICIIIKTNANLLMYLMSEICEQTEHRVENTPIDSYWFFGKINRFIFKTKQIRVSKYNFSYINILWLFVVRCACTGTGVCKYAFE